MKKLNPIVIVGGILLVAIILIPSILVLPFASGKTGTTSVEIPTKETTKDWDEVLKEASMIDVSVYRTAKDEIETVPLEQYIVGVVASEMPAEFEEEALKAQALAARTYVIKQMMSDVQRGIVKGADINDTVEHQVYKDEEQLQEQWKGNYEKNIEKIRRAVYETRGQILVYEDEPITASYFSMSNGYTENSDDYYSSAFPYLTSVESPWDTEAPKFTVETTIPVNEFESALGVKIEGSHVGKIVSRTNSNRVEKVRIGNKEFTGREIRNKLGLRSTDFTWELSGQNVVIITKGYGHGVGMSQYGANGMAKSGKTFEEIVKHYYQGVEITDATKYIEQHVVKK
ncbi:stage II sporulation protein D [Pallidibacillus pasinlerensis]|uniref:Stage II sporulation protein D n=1 Tax=Pallidibacillus pasinlerensis TaxID=2703818 RepID=A0ABX0A504_9BACI|nr:stage II sporulation protein D [Pallidibacillus pasinlerensis]NCU16282.1 stage II sporulation protein D [Pallidibacillus pasinlerensis]